MKFFILTQDDYVSPEATCEYMRNVLLEDQLIIDAFTAKGVKVERVNWSDDTIDWTSADAAIFRATWDYFHRFDDWIHQFVWYCR